MDPLPIIFSVARSTKSIKSYLGVIESSDDSISKLSHNPFNSAIENLRYAQACANIDNAASYIEVARSKFIEAINLEENENKVDAFLGLAMCQHLQKADHLARITLNRIPKEVNLTKGEKRKAIAKDIGISVAGGDLTGFVYHTINAIMHPEEYPCYKERCEKLENKKLEVHNGIRLLKSKKK